MPVTTEWADGDTVSADELNTNFEDVLNETSGITAADMHANAGLPSTVLADRFATVRETIMLAPIQDFDEAGYSTTAAAFLPPAAPSATYEVGRFYFALRPGKMAYLVDISITAKFIDVSTPGAYPAVNAVHNGTTQLGGGFAQIQLANTRYRLANSNPFDNPIISLADGDYIGIQIGTDAVAAADTSWRGAYVTLTYKIELGG
jgi:hypothetical protein